MTIVIKAQIRRLGAADVQDFREIRLSALKKAPEMFGSVYEHEEKKPMEAFVGRLTGFLQSAFRGHLLGRGFPDGRLFLYFSA